MPEPRRTDPAKIAAAAERRRVERWERWADDRVCDLCCAESGRDTCYALMEGTREQRIEWFLNRDPYLDRGMATRLADRPSDVPDRHIIQICQACWRQGNGLLNPTVTFGEVAELAMSGATEIPGMWVIQVNDEPEVPAAFRRT